MLQGGHYSFLEELPKRELPTIGILKITKVMAPSELYSDINEKPVIKTLTSTDFLKYARFEEY